MRFAIASPEGAGLSWWKRLQDEGHDVRVWLGHINDLTKPRPQRYIGDGIVTKFNSWADLLAWSKEKPTIMLFDSSGMGNLADIARKAGIFVIAGGEFCDKMEEKRLHGFAIADRIGAKLPPYKAFNNAKDALAYVKTVQHPIYFKPDRDLGTDATHGSDNGEDMAEYLEGLMRKNRRIGPCVVQDKIEGIAYSTERWFNGHKFIEPIFGTIERKKFMNDEIGPATGCSFNVVWKYDNIPSIVTDLGFDKLEVLLRANQAPPGPYDINAIVNEEGAHFLEWTPRMGFDASTIERLYYPDLGKFLYGIATGSPLGEIEDHPMIYGVRISVPPYPWSDFEKVKDMEMSIGVSIPGLKEEDIAGDDFAAYSIRKGEGGYEIASPEGIVGVAMVVGEDLEDMEERALKKAKSLKAPGGQWRTDGAKSLLEDGEQIVLAGYEIPIGMQ